MGARHQLSPIDESKARVRFFPMISDIRYAAILEAKFECIG